MAGETNRYPGEGGHSTSSPISSNSEAAALYENELAKLREVSNIVAHRTKLLHHHLFPPEQKPELQVESDRHVAIIDDIREVIEVLGETAAHLAHITDCVMGKLGNYRL